MQRENWLIGSIEPELWPSASHDLREIELTRGDVLVGEGDAVQQVFFPKGALIGLYSCLPSGDSVETAMIGWDGALGVFEACGSRKATCRARVQLAGPAWRMAADDYHRLFERSAGLRESVHKYVELLLMEARQFVACNALHPVEARLSRSILEALDRTGTGDRLPTTQEELAQALGVQRTTVSSAISQMQAQGVLRPRRGAIEVLDRKRLESRACCCWRTIADARQEILRSPEPVCD